jgi:hypothetical protein
MEKGSDGLRERLLARLPQPENVASYREEIAVLMAKHERALFWEMVTGRTFVWLGVGLFMLVSGPVWGPKLDTHGTILLDTLAVVLFFVGALNLLGYAISRSKVDLLKEVKQVQLQVLELQASLNKEGSG